MPQENTSKILAILGPTNTGKTFLAIERMLEFGNGIIGFGFQALGYTNINNVNNDVIAYGYRSLVVSKIRNVDKVTFRLY